MNIEHKSVGVDFTVKSSGAEAGTFKGYASTFGNIDRDDDVIAKGAFGALNAKGVKLLWQHQQSEPIGIWTTLKEDAKGLYAEGKLCLETRRGSEAYALMKMGALSDMSIGFRTVDSDTVKHADTTAPGGARRVRRIKKVNLFEVSLVSIPANPMANVDDVKSLTARGGITRKFADLGLPRDFDPDVLRTEREFERNLRDVGLTRKLAQILVTEGLSGVEGYLDELLRDSVGFSCKSAQIIVAGGYRAFVAKAKQVSDADADPEADIDPNIADQNSVADVRSDDVAKAATDQESKADRAANAGDEGSSSNDRVHLRDADADALSSGSELAIDPAFFALFDAEVKTISGARDS